jgi:hypothetical protein
MGVARADLKTETAVGFRRRVEIVHSVDDVVEAARQ